MAQIYLKVAQIYLKVAHCSFFLLKVTFSNIVPKIVSNYFWAVLWENLSLRPFENSPIWSHCKQEPITDNLKEFTRCCCCSEQIIWKLLKFSFLSFLLYNFWAIIIIYLLHLYTFANLDFHFILIQENAESSPGLVVMGGDSCSEGCGFES